MKSNMRCNRKPAIVLSSGGLDSTTCLAIARHAHFRPLYSLSFDYGQRHLHELDAAARVARHFGCTEHRVIRIDLRQFGKSALTDDIDVPKDRDEAKMTAEVPITYVPARNTIFLSYALAWAEVLDCRDVFIGVNAIDYSGYPDCRPEFIEAFERLANLATKMTAEQATPRQKGAETVTARNRDEATKEKFTVHAPLIRLSKSQIIRRGVELGVDYSMTHSCYDPDAEGRACGRCDSCRLRRKGFAEAGMVDPAHYAPA